MLLPATLANVFLYFSQSNLAGQIIVVILLFCSFLAWTVMVGKYLGLEKVGRGNRQFSARLEATEQLLRVDPNLKGATGPYAELARSALLAWHRAKEGPHAVAQAENALQRAVADGTIRYEDKMVLLGSIVSGAPFLGLLGTVWGVMDAFGSIAGDSSAGIATLAPGVSGALLTTVAGLIVAIPAVFGYNYLLTMVKKRIVELENFASYFADRLELEASRRQAIA